MKSIAVLALSAAAIIGAGTLSAEAAPHGGGGGFHGGGMGGGFHGGGFHGGGMGGGFHGGFAGSRVGFGGAGFGSHQFANNGYHGGGNWNRGGWGGRSLGLGIEGIGLGYGLYDYGYGDGYGYGGDYAYGDPAYYGGYDSGYGNGYGSYAYDQDNAGVSYAGAPMIQTGRSAVSGGLGKYCTTPVKSCTLYSPSEIGGGCSCKVEGGRARGQITP